MKSSFIIASLLLAALLPSCANHQAWTIQLKDGRKMVAQREPAYQSKTGYYRYANEFGRDALVQSDEVLLIERQR